MKAGLWKTFLALTGLAFASSAYAAASLKIGEPAPALKVGKWVQGDPVKEFEPGKVYIVEFWATWCGPCRISIPHLNQIYQKYKDKNVVVIGQDVWEQQEEGVAPFVKKMGTNMTYRVALDDKSQDEKGAMAATWMEAAGRNSIPTAFIINKQGRIAWIGHPMEMTEKLLDDVIADHYDLAKAAADYDKAQAEEEKEQSVQKKQMELLRKISAAIKAQNWDDAEATVKEMEKSLPADSAYPQMVRFEILLAQKKYDAAYALAGSISAAHKDDANLQNRLAWTLLARPELEKRDTALAETIAERGIKAAQGKDPSLLDTLARAQFMNGKKEEAIATEQKAVGLAQGEQQDELKKYLKSYQAGKLPAAEQ